MARQHLWRARPRGAPGAAAAPPGAQGAQAVPGAVPDHWELVEGEDVENERVLEQHRLAVQIGLLGSGNLEGFFDHEFAPEAKSIDGLAGAPVKKGQAALIDLIASQRPREDAADDDAEPPPPEAPRCPCGRRSRMNRVRVPGAADGRPYFRCAGRACRFLDFGDLGSSAQAQALRWARFDTGRADRRYEVVGGEGFRPEDARVGPEAERCGDYFADAAAALAERPEALARLLPNAGCGGGAGGCHEVRLCVDGRWRAFLIDERLPVAAVGEHPGGSTCRTGTETLAFGRAAGNQLWLPLLEKAYAKAFGSYNFALLGAPLDELLVDLTGAAVETWLLDGEVDADVLWMWLQGASEVGALVVCSSRDSGRGRGTVHALLEAVDAQDPRLEVAGIHGCRAVRLRNPRAGLHAGAGYHDVMAALQGVPAEGSTHSDGSFWVPFPREFLSSFGRADACHAKATGGNLAHTRTFEGEFAPGSGLGVRGCALRVAAGGVESVMCWLTLAQPTPRGARLLRPAMGRVLSDLGMLVIDADSHEPIALAMGGAWRSATCSLTLEAGCEYLVVPFSFRAWAGPVLLRVHCSSPAWVRGAPDDLSVQTWAALLSTMAAPGHPTLQTREPRRPARRSRSLEVDLGDGSRVTAAELVLVELEGAAMLVVCNPLDCAVLVELELEVSHMAVHTARGPQFGEWDGQRTASGGPRAWDRQPDWRRHSVEDVVPPASRQLVCALLAVARPCWAVDLGRCAASALPPDCAGQRPSGHPFAPQPAAAYGPAAERPSAPAGVQGTTESAAQPRAATAGVAAEAGRRGGARWSRRARGVSCAVCAGAAAELAPLSCCAQRVCASCARRWAEQQASDQGALRLTCPCCARALGDDELPPLLGAPALARLAEARRRAAAPAEARVGDGAWALSELPRFPGCC
ncbi:unnamed protein product [Prorocentrum cordatum]|uniref:Calpain catalytic domain-containing protein n=1 Tax=Prorocentrum cordatum TaxID=2364126 RepID=A0ABN9UE83_9DINO|nr:unnamed protein product [Polarella glacialis]